MKKLPIVIGAATANAAFYQISPFVGVPVGLVVVMFLLMHFIVLYMAYVILKYGTPSSSTFEEKFYEDRESSGDGPGVLNL